LAAWAFSIAGVSDAINPSRVTVASVFLFIERLPFLVFSRRRTRILKMHAI
jgi:hypothetical protein